MVSPTGHPTQSINRSTRSKHNTRDNTEATHGPRAVVDLARVVVTAGLDHGAEGRGGARGHAYGVWGQWIFLGQWRKGGGGGRLRRESDRHNGAKTPSASRAFHCQNRVVTVCGGWGAQPLVATISIKGTFPPPARPADKRSLAAVAPRRREASTFPHTPETHAAAGQQGLTGGGHESHGGRDEREEEGGDLHLFICARGGVLRRSVGSVNAARSSLSKPVWLPPRTAVQDPPVGGRAQRQQAPRANRARWRDALAPT